MSGDLSAIFQGRGTIPEDVVPFDAASEMEEAQQRFDFYGVALSCYLSKLQQGLFKNYVTLFLRFLTSLRNAF